MSKKREITADEQALFRDAVKGTTRLTSSDRHTPEPLKPTLPRRRPEPLETISSPTIYLCRQEAVDGEETLQFNRGGLQHKLLQNMRRGQVTIQASLDLHGLTMEQAEIILHEFIADCCQRGKRWICLVHGKGHYSPEGKPILKNWANQWLREHPQVLAFHSARPKDGGTGALYVLLKRALSQ